MFENAIFSKMCLILIGCCSQTTSSATVNHWASVKRQDPCLSFSVFRISLVLAQKWRRSWGRSGASWRHLEAPYGFKFFFIYIKSYMSYNLCSIIFFVSPLLLGAPLLIEVGGDQEPPGNTSRYPMGSKFFLLILNHIWATICVL